MKNQLPKILFFGTESYSLRTLEALVETGYDVLGVITKPDTPKGRGHTLTPPPVKTFALKHNIPVYQPRKSAEIMACVAPHLEKNPLGVLVAYGKIIPQSVLDALTIVNIHPSLLPRWRGPSPIETTIAKQDAHTGVSIMKLTAEMDTGPIYWQHSWPLADTDDKHSLYEKLFAVGSEKIVELLPAIGRGEMTAEEQDDEKATYCSLLTKDLSTIDPKKMTADAASAHIRAYLDFPRSRMFIPTTNQTHIITKAHANSTAQTQLDVQCSDGNWLVIDELVAPSGKKISADDFIRGYVK